MADEVTITADMALLKGDLAAQRTARRLRADMSGESFSWVVQGIGTSHEALDISAEVTTAGYAWFRNLDGTNFVEVGVEDGTPAFIPLIKLGPGHVALLPLATNSVFARADTAAVNLEHWVLSA